MAVALSRSFVPADSGGAMPDSHRLPVTETAFVGSVLLVLRKDERDSKDQKDATTDNFLSIALALVHPAKIDLLEAEALKQFHGRLIPLDGLHLHQSKILFLQVAEQIDHQEFSQALA